MCAQGEEFIEIQEDWDDVVSAGKVGNVEEDDFDEAAFDTFMQEMEALELEDELGSAPNLAGPAARPAPTKEGLKRGFLLGSSSAPERKVSTSAPAAALVPSGAPPLSARDAAVSGTVIERGAPGVAAAQRYATAPVNPLERDLAAGPGAARRPSAACFPPQAVAAGGGAAAAAGSTARRSGAAPQGVAAPPPAEKPRVSRFKQQRHGEFE